MVRRETISDRIRRFTALHQTDTSKLVISPAEPTTTSSSSPVVPPTRAAKHLRSSSAARSVDSREEIEISQAKRMKCNTTAIVVISQEERDAALRELTESQLPTTPKRPKSPRTPSKRRPGAIMRYPLPSGTTIWLTPKEYKQTQADLIPLAKDVAHPPVPLLFRYSTEGCQSPLTSEGFCAGRFATTVIPPPQPPSLEAFPWSCAATHLNRDRAIASPCKTSFPTAEDVR